MIHSVLLALAIGGIALLAVPVDPAWRMIGALVLLLSAIILSVLGLPAGAHRDPKARVRYDGSFPPLPTGRWATAWAKPEGLVLDFGRDRRRLIKYDRLAQAVVTHTGREGRRAVFAYVDDAVTHALYPIWLVPKHPLDADRLLRAVLRRNYENADRTWKAWRTLAIDLVVTPGDLQKGTTRQIQIQRKIACARCGGLAEASPECRECGGHGSTIQGDVATIVIPKRSRSGKEIVLPELGNGDVNGYRGPLVVRLVRDYAGNPSRS